MQSASRYFCGPITKIVSDRGIVEMNRSQLAYKIENQDKKWKDTLMDICEVARLCLHNLVGSNTPPLPRCYEREFEQAALHLGKEDVLDMARVDSDRQAYTIKTAILQASERIGEAKLILRDFDQEARRELGHMEHHLEALNSQLKLFDSRGFKAIVDSAVSFKDCGQGFVEELSGVIDEIDRQQEMLQALVQKVHEDPLTGVLNRRAWERDLKKLSGFVATQQNAVYSIVIADIDNFKDINDRHGHPVGDAVLKQFAAILKDHFSKTGAVYRYGGDEFTVIVKGFDAGSVQVEVDRLRQRLSQATFVAMGGMLRIRISASFGLSQGNCEMDVKSVISEADEMLYLAKKAGRNCIICHPS